MIVTTNPAATVAITAVNIHPATMVKIPLTRLGAQSLLHAPSARAVAITTIKVTKVVDNGSLYAVAKEIIAAETIKATDPLNKSKSPAKSLSFESNLVPNHSRKLFGKIFVKPSNR